MDSKVGPGEANERLLNLLASDNNNGQYLSENHL